jgi:hypothetical protein
VVYGESVARELEQERGGAQEDVWGFRRVVWVPWRALGGFYWLERGNRSVARAYSSHQAQVKRRGERSWAASSVCGGTIKVCRCIRIRQGSRIQWGARGREVVSWPRSLARLGRGQVKKKRGGQVEGVQGRDLSKWDCPREAGQVVHLQINPTQISSYQVFVEMSARKLNLNFEQF